MSAGSSNAAPDPFLGKRIWTCEIQKKLGSGGMGSVYLGRHLDLDKPVAVKIMARELMASDDHVRRFRREAQLAAKLEHPNVVTVHHVGEQDGTHFIVMQYVDGRTLDDVLEERGKLALGEAVSVVKRVAFALGAAHKLGMVHRDIKPANILISRDGIVKVADFGLARPGGDHGQSISATGQIVGTPSYMSPEQAQGGVVDARSDIYSLGATFYHLVTGRRCFEGNTPLSIVIKHIQENPPDPHLVNTELPPAVSRVILKMMAKSPKDRYASTDDLIRDLDLLKGSLDGTAKRLAAGAAPATVIASPSSFAPAPVPFNPWKWIGIAAGVGLGIGALIVGGILLSKDDPPQPTPAPTPVPVAASPSATPSPIPSPSATPVPTPSVSPSASPSAKPPTPYSGELQVVIDRDLQERYVEGGDAKDREDFRGIVRLFRDVALAVRERDPEKLRALIHPEEQALVKNDAAKVKALFSDKGHRNEMVLDRIELLDVEFRRGLRRDVKIAHLKVEYRTVNRADDSEVIVKEQPFLCRQHEGRWYLSVFPPPK